MNTKHENRVLTLVAASTTSIVMGLAWHWVGPVFIGIGALSVFCIILRTGLTASGAETFWGYSVVDFALIWLWLALVVWFALATGYFFLWIAGAALVLAGVFSGRFRACRISEPK